MVPHPGGCAFSAPIRGMRRPSFRGNPPDMLWTGAWDRRYDARRFAGSTIIADGVARGDTLTLPDPFRQGQTPHICHHPARKSGAVDSGILPTAILPVAADSRGSGRLAPRGLDPFGHPRTHHLSSGPETSPGKATGTAPVVAPCPLLWGQGKVEAVACRPDPAGVRRSDETRGKRRLSRRRPQALRLPAAAADSARDSAGPPAPPAPPEEPQGPPAPAPAD